MTKIDVEKLICSFLNPSNETREKLTEEKHLIVKKGIGATGTVVPISFVFSLLEHALEEQGIEFVDGKLVNKE